MSFFAGKYIAVAGLALLHLAAVPADRVNPNQAEIDQIKNETEVVTARTEAIKAENTYLKEQYAAFPDGYGKKGTLTTQETDKVRLAARTMEAMQAAAKKLVEKLELKKNPVPMVLMTDADRSSVPLYWSENITLGRLASVADSLTGRSVTSTNESTSILGVGMLLSQVAQFSQLFRTDKSVAFTPTALPEEALLDLVSFEAGDKLFYPTADIDGILTRRPATDFTLQLAALNGKRAALQAVNDPANKPKATLVLSQLDALNTRMAAVDATTKMPVLFNVLRGELVSQYLDAAKGKILSVSLVAQGGASLKTSSIWRADRFYISGGVVLNYKVTGPQTGRILDTGSIATDSNFQRVTFD